MATARPPRRSKGCTKSRLTVDWLVRFRPAPVKLNPVWLAMLNSIRAPVENSLDKTALAFSTQLSWTLPGAERQVFPRDQHQTSLQPQSGARWWPPRLGSRRPNRREDLRIRCPRFDRHRTCRPFADWETG